MSIDGYRSVNVKRPDQAPGPKAAIVGAAPVLEAVVLGAGAGARFGGAKLLAPWRAGVLLDAALACAFAAPVRGVTLAVGADDERVAAAAKVFAARRGELDRLTIISTPDWALGMSASLKRAIAGLAPDVDAALVFLADMPLIPSSVPTALAQALTGDVVAAAPVFDGKLGHPALIRASLFPEIAGLEGDRGARRLLEALGPRLARVIAPDAGVLFDIDTQGALIEAERLSVQAAEAS
jgi:molybdenum cofactor cytidylyltransferase